MTQAQRRTNRGVWRYLETFRYRRWQYWRSSKALNKRLRGNKARWMELRRKWWGKYIEARDKRAWYDKEIAAHTPKPAPSAEGLTNFDGHPVANWIIPILYWARHVGNGHEKWEGVVVSGFRTRLQQWLAAVKYGLWHYRNGNPFLTNHMKYVFPGGAVDVTEYEQLARVLRSYPGARKIFQAVGIGDLVHFSANAH